MKSLSAVTTVMLVTVVYCNGAHAADPAYRCGRPH